MPDFMLFGYFLSGSAALFWMKPDKQQPPNIDIQSDHGGGECL